MERSMRQRQQGMTFIGLLCILALVGVIGYAGIRLVPVYLNYMKIARTMEMTATEFKGENPDPGNIRRILERHWADRGSQRRRVQGHRDHQGRRRRCRCTSPMTMSVPYIANVSLSVHFDKTVKVQ